MNRVKKHFVSIFLVYFVWVVIGVLVVMSFAGFPFEQSVRLALLFAVSFTGAMCSTKWSQKYHGYKQTKTLFGLFVAMLYSIIFVVVTCILLELIGVYQVAWEALLFAGFGAVLGIFIPRLLFELVEDRSYPLVKRGKKALIIGAGEAGQIVLNELKVESENPLFPVLYLDDDKDKQGMKIQSIPVLGKVEDLEWIVHRFRIEVVIIAIPSAPKKEISSIVGLCEELELEVRMLPSIREIIDKQVNTEAGGDVQMQD
ncbi:hypothetical protein LCM20_09090 [Halobacillus litoralis]|uniref:nucleoside-diphosphate sugar epimerase/dehydratase n=1 Tax=Halobacillus litoralis TaxID=45668 RepID=UPI001CD69280|nr:hypothetical protein [Halobacillus litoralis]MCA0970742.1 hypothetical protein [Halobacillus litoralis]